MLPPSPGYARAIRKFVYSWSLYDKGTALQSIKNRNY